MQLRRLMSYAGKRIKTSAIEHVYLRTNIDLTRPHSIGATLTERCNYRCEYCTHWRQDRYPTEMTLDDWKRALLSLKELVFPYVIQFGGGEPFVWPHFLELVEFCRAEDIDWGVTTNGSALNERSVKRIVRSRPVNVNISVDSSVAHIHDQARGINGSLKRIERGIRLLIEEQARAEQHFLIRIKPTVHRHNIDNLGQLVDWCLEVGATTVDFSPVRLQEKGERERLYLRSEDDLARLKAAIDDLIERKRQGQPIETSEAKLRGMLSHFKDELVVHGTGQCRVGLRDYSIRANGDVIVCWFFDPIGNVKEQSAKEIWSSAQARQTRTLTATCEKFGTSLCASSCLAKRSLLQDVRRAFLMHRTLLQ
ncbi:radical SAM additional 4Fe4S-binding SPASM domain-containing protein [Bradyrhizobium erythrophlei]|uniref:Radical SAM additional 4Fe4S-binding SPASM domain-containing protein n=2 Tax=Bradyrhizobium erythrophlei TaxID=1437360 RepID=A0A1M5TDE0_9BRAD|nr:radical SAM additional 4Fe4S-binding SPASM domain-containing protein [Bradyrhizobium erythrophlei]